MAKNKHMTPEMRSTIESELTHGSSFKQIGALVGKDCTTISKEVRKHSYKKKSGAIGKPFNDCIHSAKRECKVRDLCDKCKTPNQYGRYCWSCGQCSSFCDRYEKYNCPLLEKPPYVCNGCKSRRNCTLEKTLYSAYPAQKAYREQLSSAREGFCISDEELQQLDAIVSPLLKNGQSIHHIAINHKSETMTSERTLYAYVNNGLFSARNIDMPRTVQRKPRKGKKKSIKVDTKCREGRTLEDYLSYMGSHPDTAVCQLDSVEGVKGGKVLLTIHFVKQELQLAFQRDSNNAQSVTDIFEKMYWELGPDIYMLLFPVLLADNGSEFSDPLSIEFDKEGNRRSHVFYCDASAPYQKGACENNHEMIRRIIPKGIDLGMYSQDQITLMMSHINSYARKNLGDKTPYDIFAFLYSEDILKNWGLQKIEADKIVLRPSLLSKG